MESTPCCNRAATEETCDSECTTGHRVSRERLWPAQKRRRLDRKECRCALLLASSSNTCTGGGIELEVDGSCDAACAAATMDAVLLLAPPPGDATSGVGETGDIGELGSRAVRGVRAARPVPELAPACTCTGTGVEKM